MLSGMAGKKTTFFHIRMDPELKQALQAAAARADRSETDQARHILRLALGLKEPEHESYAVDRDLTKEKRQRPPPRKVTG